MLNHPHRTSQRVVERSHPLGITFRQIIVDRNEVSPFPCERIQVNRKRRDERLAFAGLHFSNFPFVQDHPA